MEFPPCLGAPQPCASCLQSLLLGLNSLALQASDFGFWRRLFSPCPWPWTALLLATLEQRHGLLVLVQVVKLVAMMVPVLVTVPKADPSLVRLRFYDAFVVLAAAAAAAPVVAFAVPLAAAQNALVRNLAGVSEMVHEALVHVFVDLLSPAADGPDAVTVVFVAQAFEKEGVVRVAGAFDLQAAHLARHRKAFATASLELAAAFACSSAPPLVAALAAPAVAPAVAAAVAAAAAAGSPLGLTTAVLHDRWDLPAVDDDTAQVHPHHAAAPFLVAAVAVLAAPEPALEAPPAAVTRVHNAGKL